MPRILILADDLSGAADCAAASAASGLSATVALDLSDLNHPSEILSVDCDTRHLDGAQAATRVAQVLRPYGSDHDLVLFKKIDSTLRGNIAAELAAMLAVRRAAAPPGQHVVAVMAPAFPAGGRTTVDGHQLLHGKALHESEIWRHQSWSGPTHIPSMLALENLRTVLLGLDIVRSGWKALGEAMVKSAISADVLVCDAETDADLRAITQASMTLGKQTIWAGSAGLATHLPQVTGHSGAISPAERVKLAEGPTLIVIGSISSVSRHQADVLEQESTADVLRMACSVLLAGPWSSQWSEYARDVATKLRLHHDVVVILEAREPIQSNNGRFLSEALGTLLEPHRNTVGAIVATGGETARAIFDHWQVKRLRMITEIEPGLPLSIASVGDRNLPVLTKAGAFGNGQTLNHCWKFLQVLDRSGAIVNPTPEGFR
jgi:4-hydroxythreonine-4-phosphate dehydrogenase